MQGEREKIKVLFILTALHKDGAVLSTLTTLKHLDRSRFEPRLFVLKQTDITEEGSSWNTMLQEMDVIYGLQHGQKFPNYAIGLVQKFYKLVKQSHIIIGGLEMAPTFLSAISGRLTAKPSIGFIRNSLPELLEELPPYFKWLTRLMYPLLTKGIAISDGIRESTQKLIPKLKGRISTVYIPIDIDHIRQLGQMPLPQAKTLSPYFLAVGRLLPQKGFDILLRAYAIARERGISQHLVIVGEGKEQGLLEKLIVQLGLSGKVLLAGFQTNPYAWMKNADIFVSSSRFEGFCRVLAEAQAVGTPVVSTDCPHGPVEVLQDGLSGILVKTEDPEALAKGMVALLRDQEMMQKLSLRGIERVEQFTPRATISVFENILTALYDSRYRRNRLK